METQETPASDDPFASGVQVETVPDASPAPEANPAEVTTDPAHDALANESDPIADPPTTAATPEVPAQADGDAAEDEPKVRRGRGNLELDVKAITDAFCEGDITVDDGALLTPHRICGLIESRLGGSKPSGGAVSNVLKRWSDIGYAVVNEKPLAFRDYTDAARNDGLSALKARAKEAAKQAASDAS